MAVAAEPVVRLRAPLHGALHGLHDRDRLAHRQAARIQPGLARQPVERAVEEGPKIAGRVGMLDDEHDGTRDGAAAQRDHRRQHRVARGTSTPPRTR